ncbi:hypothetical protein AVL62_04315 [Serinicoccus chungangensis]|uniref:Uncharacterized protein n=1 Tax=Serinicoccus chungangensis TaxID=767452 RepID=A0A0W8I764_9MICO|nr:MULTISPECIES: hypothetical protein [Serinicoccus]KUG54437.1 hypothetical protein AVL62_04315 [Serinicoccus chungangensis]PZU39140.1 MAG: hypothetical protein DI571_14910 [Arsenicicoccus sp.]
MTFPLLDLGQAARAASETGEPAAALRAAARLRQLTEAVELRQVEAALEAGLSWAQIADCLGVTRQAAHKRFRSRVRPDLVKGSRSR